MCKQHMFVNNVITKKGSTTQTRLHKNNFSSKTWSEWKLPLHGRITYRHCRQPKLPSFLYSSNTTSWRLMRRTNNNNSKTWHVKPVISFESSTCWEFIAPYKQTLRHSFNLVLTCIWRRLALVLWHVDIAIDRT